MVGSWLFHLSRQVTFVLKKINRKKINGRAKLFHRFYEKLKKSSTIFLTCLVEIIKFQYRDPVIVIPEKRGGKRQRNPWISVLNYRIAVIFSLSFSNMRLQFSLFISLNLEVRNFKHNCFVGTIYPQNAK